VESQFRNETQLLQRQERDRYGSFLWNMMRLDMGPKVTIHKLVGANQDVAIDFKHESALNASVDYYGRKSHPGELIQVLKFFCAYLMQQARKETRVDRRQFLLFKVVDCARTIVQHSPMSVNADAEMLVLGIFVALARAHGEPFQSYARAEDRVVRLMRRLQVIPKEPNVRMQMAEALMEQGGYLDALVQYHTLLRMTVRRGDSNKQHAGWIAARIADVFQTVSRVTPSKLKDARKLRAFIDRYNRDLVESGRELPRLTQVHFSQINRVRRALIVEANRWALQAARAPTLDRRQRLRMAALAGENCNALQRHREGLQILAELSPLWRHVQETPGSLRDHADYLKHYTVAAMHAKDRDAMTRAAREANDVNTKLSAIESRRRAHEQARMALLG
jgi:hypothetical protein